MSTDYGPQHKHVAALIDQARRLTADEAQALYAAWITAGLKSGRAVDVATRAARYAAACDIGNTSDAADEATWDALAFARAPAGVAAGDAALALATRHLIDQHGYTQAHYDTLTAPWASVIGPAHPNDKRTT